MSEMSRYLNILVLNVQVNYFLVQNVHVRYVKKHNVQEIGNLSPEFLDAKSSAECYSVLCPFLTKMSIKYRWNQHQMFYLQSSLDVAYHISMRIYKLFNLASLPKNDFTLVLYCSMSILNQWNASIKKGLVTWLLRSHEHILLCHWFSTTITNYLRMRRQIVVKSKVLQFTS